MSKVSIEIFVSGNDNLSHTGISTVRPNLPSPESALNPVAEIDLDVFDRGGVDERREADVEEGETDGDVSCVEDGRDVEVGAHAEVDPHRSPRRWWSRPRSWWTSWPARSDVWGNSSSTWSLDCCPWWSRSSCDLWWPSLCCSSRMRTLRSAEYRWRRAGTRYGISSAPSISSTSGRHTDRWRSSMWTGWPGAFERFQIWRSRWICTWPSRVCSDSGGTRCGRSSGTFPRQWPSGFQ